MTSLAPGQNIGHYRIVRPIGQGGMGAVFLAEDTKLGRHVALKVLPAEVASSAERLERFRREAKTVAALNHPHIVTLYSVEEDGGTPFLTMEWVEGESLDRTLPPGGLALAKVLEIGTALADALAAAHEKGIIHRDLKPANVIVTKDGRVKVLDFGLAKHLGEPGPSGGAADEGAGPTATARQDDSLTAAGAVLGTVPYMSPEQLGGEACDARADVFSLGVVLYELSTGRRPFGGKNKAETISSILRDAPRPLVEARQDAPRQLGRIIDHCLQKDPDARFQSAKDVRNELRALQKELDSAPVTVTRRSAPSSRGRSWQIGVVGAVGAAVLAGASWIAVRDRSAEWAAKPSAAESGTRAAAAHETSSLAVMPFLNMSADKDQEYFSDGLTEELLNALVKIPELKVAGRTSSFSFKGKSEDLRTIGEKLGVEHILEGSVRKAGDRIRVTAQLVKAADGFHLWSETYDRRLDDVFAVQDDIARSVAAALKVTLLGKPETEKQPDAVAYDLVLQARFTMQGRPEHVRKARGMLERALALAPDYAPAWAEMGLAHRRAVEAAATVEERRRASDLSRQALAKALQLDPGLALAHSRMAAVHVDDWEFEAAERASEQALAADPKNPLVMGNAALIYDYLGRHEEAVALGEQVLEVDPLNPNGPLNLASAYLEDRRFEEAEALCRRGIELRPDLPLGHSLLGLALLLNGKAEEARQASARAAELLGQEGVQVHANALVDHTLGHAEASAAAAREFEARFAASDPYSNAQIRAWRGDADGAFAWLDRAVAARDPYVASIRTDPLLVSLHTDSRWKPLLEKVGVPSD